MDRVSGEPDEAHIRTSYNERANLTHRMGMRRFTRLTNWFSKSFVNHCHAINLHMMHCEFYSYSPDDPLHPGDGCRVTDHLWTMANVVELIEPRECEGSVPTWAVTAT